MAGRHALPCLQRRLGQIAGCGTSRTGDDDRRRMISLVVVSTPFGEDSSEAWCFQNPGRPVLI
jgi:hypothetical protein